MDETKDLYDTEDLGMDIMDEEILRDVRNLLGADENTDEEGSDELNIGGERSSSEKTIPGEDTDIICLVDVLVSHKAVEESTAF